MVLLRPAVIRSNRLRLERSEPRHTDNSASSPPRCSFQGGTQRNPESIGGIEGRLHRSVDAPTLEGIARCKKQESALSFASVGHRATCGRRSSCGIEHQDIFRT